MDEKTVATLIQLGIAAAGVISTTLFVVRIHNLKTDIRILEKKNEFWMLKYKKVLSKLTIPQLIDELDTSLTNIQFTQITKDL